MLVGFAYPKSPLDAAKEHPGPDNASAWLGWPHDAELGLVVVDLDPDDAYTASFQMYLLLEMMDGLCTPYQFHQGLMFYLPEFRDNTAAGKTRGQLWNQQIRSRASALLEDGTRESSDEEMSLREGAGESSVSEFHPDSNIDEELPDDDMSLFVPDETKSDEEEPLAEIAGESSNKGESHISSHNDAGDPDNNPEHTFRLIDELSLCETSHDIQHIDHTLRIHLARKPYQQKSAMREFLDLSRPWNGRDSHSFCVEMAASGQLDKAPRLSEVTSIREALVHLKVDLGYEWLGKFFKFTMILLKDEHTKPVPQDAVNYAVLKSLELLAALQQAS